MNRHCMKALIQQVLPIFSNPLYRKLTFPFCQYSYSSPSATNSLIVILSNNSWMTGVYMVQLYLCLIYRRNLLEVQLRYENLFSQMAQNYMTFLQQPLKGMLRISMCLPRLAVNSSIYSPQKRQRLLRPTMNCYASFMYLYNYSPLSSHKFRYYLRTQPENNRRRTPQHLLFFIIIHNCSSISKTITPKPINVNVRNMNQKSIVLTQMILCWSHMSKKVPIRAVLSLQRREVSIRWLRQAQRGKRTVSQSKSILQTDIISSDYSCL